VKKKFVFFLGCPNNARSLILRFQGHWSFCVAFFCQAGDWGELVGGLVIPPLIITCIWRGVFDLATDFLCFPCFLNVTICFEIGLMCLYGFECLVQFYGSAWAPWARPRPTTGRVSQSRRQVWQAGETCRNLRARAMLSHPAPTLG
jgi:hypothetical protein